MRLARANRRDENEKEIVDALRAVGASVERMDKPLDLLVGFRGRNYLLEVKLMPGKGVHKKRTIPNPEQVKWISLWKGQVSVVRSIDEALEAITS